MEEYLFSLGLYKKAIAKDGSSLFRAVSEQLFFTQVQSFKIRQHCADFMERNEDLYEKLTDGDVDSNLEKVRSPNDYPGPPVLSALSKLYKKLFMIYQEVGEPPYQPFGDNGHRDAVVLTSTDGMHYDTVYPKTYLAAAALCQSIVYEILYKRVFKFGECVDIAVSKMLHDKAYSKQRRCHLLNPSFVECFKLDDNEEDKPNEEQTAEMEIKKALAQGIPPFPYKVAKALDPLIYRNVEYDIWNEKRKEQMKNEQLVTPDIAPGVKCLVRLHQEQKEPFVAYIQELSTEQGPVTVYIEELCKKYTIPLDYVEVVPVPAYKVMWQNVRQNKGFPGCSRSPGQEKCKGKKKYVRKGTMPNFPCLTSPGCQLPDQVHETVTSGQRSRNNSGKQFSHNNNARCTAQQYKWKSNRQCDTSFYRPPQNSCQSPNEDISPRNKNCGSTMNFSPGVNCQPCDPDSCHTTAYAQPWRRPSRVFQSSPIAIPVKTVDNLHRSQSQDVPVANALKIPATQPVTVPQSAEEASPTSGVPTSGSPVTYYPYPMYTGMLVMYGDGSVHPVSVSPWRQEYPGTDSAQGVTGVYYNGLGTSPNCISPPLTQWVPAPAAGYGAPWSATGSSFTATSLPGEMAYSAAVYGTPPWSPPSGFVVPPPQVTYQMSPNQHQFLPLQQQQQVQSAARKPPA